MKDLRDEVRAAFEKEQAAHPPTAGMRRSIVDATVTTPHRQTRLQWIAVAAALVITALVIASLVTSRLVMHTTVPSHHAPTGDYGPPPAGVALVYVSDPNHPGWYVGFDWSGTPRATIKLQKPLDTTTGLVQSPDGSNFVTTIGAKGGGGEFYDRLGNPVASGPEFVSAVWADDNRHMCGMVADQISGWWYLATQLPRQPAREVAQIVPYSANTPVAVSVIACSFAADKAVLAKGAASRPAELWAIQLSTGKVVIHRSITAQGIGTVVASPDATFMAQNWGPHTDIVRVADGSVVASLDPAWIVLAFGPDDQTLLVTSGWPSAGRPTQVAVVDLSGRVLWENDGSQELATFFVEPAHGFVVMLKTPADQYWHPSIEVALVTGEGKAVVLQGGYLRP